MKPLDNNSFTLSNTAEEHKSAAHGKPDFDLSGFQPNNKNARQNLQTVADLYDVNFNDKYNKIKMKHEIYNHQFL